MYAYWKLWVDVLNIGLDAQRVIAMRLAKIAKGGAAAEAECRRMVSEKFLAAAAARDAAAAALVGGKGIDTAARLALTPIERAKSVISRSYRVWLSVWQCCRQRVT